MKKTQDLQGLQTAHYVAAKNIAATIAKLHKQISQTVKRRNEKNQHTKSEVGYRLHKSPRVYTDLNKLYVK